MQDTILWVHIGIQILAFGLLFPTGMVLGVQLLSLPIYVDQVLIEPPDSALAMARSSANSRRDTRDRWLFPRARPWWPSICA